MLSYLQSVLVVLACVVLVLCALTSLDRRLDALPRKRANGVNGWQLSILGTVYAVSLGFMLSDAWLAYQTAAGDVRKEADATDSLAHVASGLPPSCRESVQTAVKGYGLAIVQTEWPTMAQGQPDWKGAPKLDEIWNNTQTCGGKDLSPTDHQLLVDALTRLESHRSARIDDYEGRLPELMWAVMLVGAASVIASSCLLANEKQTIHRFHVVSLTVLISLMLLAIEDLDLPFQGATHIAAPLLRYTLSQPGG